jgi:hypothetical protein
LRYEYYLKHDCARSEEDRFNLSLNTSWNEMGFSNRFEAPQNEQINKLRRLLIAGADMNTKDEKGMTAPLSSLSHVLRILLKPNKNNPAKAPIKTPMTT